MGEKNQSEPEPERLYPNARKSHRIIYISRAAIVYPNATVANNENGEKKNLA